MNNSLVCYPSELYYSGASTVLSIQVIKRSIKSVHLLASQKPRDNAVSSFIVNTGI